VIAFEGVVVRYPRAERPAVDGVSLGAGRGTITAVVGPNGSGKSTLVRALLGRVAIERGRVLVDGTDAASLDRRVLARYVAVVGQREEPAFPITVRDYVAMGRYPYVGTWGAYGGRDLASIQAAIARADVAGFAERTTDQLSGGEWQRVRIARALAQDAAAIVLDEPTTYLDVAHEMETFELLDALARDGHAVLVVSHQLNLVARFASVVALLDRGTLVAQGTPADVMRGEILERVYRWPLVVSHDPAVGSPALIPLRRTHSR
jgi:ABC-type cobalamin/Fe3+-siderophores transport system ATPase subunit